MPGPNQSNELASPDSTSARAVLLAVLLAFGYGALHTLGPGHGKAVVVSYFVGTGGSLRRGLTMGVRIAVFHVLSAVLVVFLLDLAVRQATGAAPSDYRAIRLASYALIIAIGTVMLWQAVASIRGHRSAIGSTGGALMTIHTVTRIVRPALPAPRQGAAVGWPRQSGSCRAPAPCW